LREILHLRMALFTQVMREVSAAVMVVLRRAAGRGRLICLAVIHRRLIYIASG